MKKQGIIVMTILIFVVVVGITMGCTYLFVKSNVKTCKKCDTCKVCPKEPTFSENYFDLVNGTTTTDERMIYIQNEWYRYNRMPINPMGKDYNSFLDKLVTTQNSTAISKNTTYATYDSKNRRLTLTLKTNGQYSVLVNTCNGFTTVNGNYKLFNNELVLLNYDEENEEKQPTLLFLYPYGSKTILKSINYNDCNSVSGGALFTSE